MSPCGTSVHPAYEATAAAAAAMTALANMASSVCRLNVHSRIDGRPIAGPIARRQGHFVRAVDLSANPYECSFDAIEDSFDAGQGPGQGAGQGEAGGAR